MIQIFSEFWHDESGSTAIEYALMLGVLAVGSLAGLVGATERIVSSYNTAPETAPMIAMSDTFNVTHTR